MRILLADDERVIADSLAQYLESCGHQVCTVTTGGLDVLPACDRFQPDVVMMDVLMPRFDGITIARALLARNPAAKVILFSGSIDAGHPFIVSEGDVSFLPKPFRFQEVREALEKLAPRKQAAA